jgi:hypothetical protein
MAFPPLSGGEEGGAGIRRIPGGLRQSRQVCCEGFPDGLVDGKFLRLSSLLLLQGDGVGHLAFFVQDVSQGEAEKVADLQGAVYPHHEQGIVSLAEFSGAENFSEGEDFFGVADCADFHCSGSFRISRFIFCRGVLCNNITQGKKRQPEKVG